MKEKTAEESYQIILSELEKAAKLLTLEQLTDIEMTAWVLVREKISEQGFNEY